ncbi:MAG: type III secretion system inner membrane ring subunit SctD [Desulfobacterium sp.]|nr:type III secretion system inner membrane ring subunit SctD [Desulfobacterium sp.]
MTRSATILLKIFSGPHLGAEVSLSPGTITLGSGNSCDIIIQDTTVAERHLRISIPDAPNHPESISIKSMDAPVILLEPGTNAGNNGEANTTDAPLDPGTDQAERPQTDRPEDAGQSRTPGERLVEGDADWRPLTVLLIGTTSIAWKFEDDSWDKITASNLFSGRTFTQEASAESQQGDGQENASVQEEKKKPTIVLPGIARKILKGVGALAIFLLVFGPCLGTKDTHLARNMTHVLEDNGFEYLAVTQTNIGVTVFGTVDTQADRSRLWQMAGKVDYPVFIDIRVNEERAFAVKVALSVRGLFPEVALKEKDILIKGYMRDKLIEGASKIWIRNDISEVKTIDSAMVYAFQVWPVLKDRLIRHKLENRVIIRFHPGLVQVEGELDFDQRQTLETVKGEVCEALGSPIAFWDTLTAPGFSDEWNASLNSNSASRFSPDPALAKLFLDSQSSKGVPAFIASTPGHRAGQKQFASPAMPVSSSASPYSKTQLQKKIKGAEKTTDSKGNTLAVIRDEEGNILGAVGLDDKGRIKLTPSGDPLILPVIKDKHGKVVKNKKGQPVFAETVTDAQGNPVFKENKPDPTRYPARDSQGNFLVDDQGRVVTGEILRNEDGTIKRDEQGNILVKDAAGNIVATKPAAMDHQGNVLVDNQGRVVAGEVLRNEDGTIQRDEQGNILVRDTDGKTIAARSAARDPKGNLLVDDQGRVVAGEVLRNEDGTIKRDEQGNFLVRDTAGNIIAARPISEDPANTIAERSAARDPQGNVLVDDQGRMVAGEVLRNEDGTIKRDEQGNVLVRDTAGNIIAARPASGGNPGNSAQGKIPVITGPVLDGEGKIIHDKKGNPIMGRVAFDKDGKVVTDAEGNPVVLGVALDEKNKPLRDADQTVVPLTIARNADNGIVRDTAGNPLLVPALLDRDGRIVRDKNGEPMAPRVITGADNRAVFDNDGNLILDQDANTVLTRKNEPGNKDGTQPNDRFSGPGLSNMASGSNPSPGTGSAPSDKNVFGSGTVLADKIGQVKKEDPLGGLSIVSITLDPIPFISMKDGQKFFNGGKLPGGHVIKTITTDELVLEKNGKKTTFKMRQN